MAHVKRPDRLQRLLGLEPTPSPKLASAAIARSRQSGLAGLPVLDQFDPAPEDALPAGPTDGPEGISGIAGGSGMAGASGISGIAGIPRMGGMPCMRGHPAPPIWPHC